MCGFRVAILVVLASLVICTMKGGKRASQDAARASVPMVPGVITTRIVKRLAKGGIVACVR